MLSVSNEFKTATTSTIRHVKARLEFIWTDVYTDPLLDTTSNSDNYNITYALSESNVNIAKQVSNGNQISRHEYCLLDGSWSLNGTKYTGPHTPDEILINEIGWYSSAVCGANGVFTGTIPYITVNFQARLVTSLLVAGYSDAQYPADFDIYLYAGATQLYHQHFVNTQKVWTQSVSSMTNVTTMKLVINKWSTGNTVAKILEFYTVEKDTFDGDMITTLNLLEEREVRNGSSPVGNISSNEIDISLQNVKIGSIVDPFTPGNPNTPYVNFLKENRRVKAYYGFDTGSMIEYVPIGTFWTDEWVCKDTDYTVKISAQDRMKFFKSTKFEGEIKFNITLYDLAVYVCEQARLKVIQDLTYNLDPELQNITIPVAYFDKVSYFEVFRSIAEAACGTCYMSKEDVLIIESYKANYDGTAYLEISSDNMFSKDQPINRDDMRNNIIVDIYNVTMKEEDGETYVNLYSMSDDSDPYTIDAGEQDKVIEIDYSQSPSINAIAELVDVVGADPYLDTNKSEFFSWGCRLYVTNMNSTAGTFGVSIQGQSYDSTSKDKYIVPDANDSDGQYLIKEYGKKEQNYKNHLIQDTSTAIAIANALYASYSLPRRDVSVTWRGDPSTELGDKILVNDYGENKNKYVVYKNKWTFDGGLKCTTNARRVISGD
jgi:hypothetical protein